jgi:hypothetical protein
MLLSKIVRRTWAPASSALAGWGLGVSGVADVHLGLMLLSAAAIISVLGIYYELKEKQWRFLGRCPGATWLDGASTSGYIPFLGASLSAVIFVIFIILFSSFKEKTNGGESENSQKLAIFYGELGGFVWQELPTDMSEDNYNKWVLDVVAEEDKIIKWMHTNMGSGAEFAFSAPPDGSFRKIHWPMAISAKHDVQINILLWQQHNIEKMMHSRAWDK